MDNGKQFNSDLKATLKQVKELSALQTSAHEEISNIVTRAMQRQIDKSDLQLVDKQKIEALLAL